MLPQLCIGVDTGGTFTDLVLDLGCGRYSVHKVLSTPDDPARAVLQGIAELLERSGLVRTEQRLQVLHGSTVATNALLEGKGAQVAFVTTRGFEDTLFIGRQHRPQLYALEPVKPAIPLAEQCVFGVAERLDANGGVLKALTSAEITRVVQALTDAHVAAVALSLLHSYANPAHELALAAAIRAALPDVHLTVSHELLPEFREYERGATCLINAVVAPKMAGYIEHLDQQLGHGALRIMASSGGTLPPDEVKRFPAHTILSGPAGGILGALGQACGAGCPRVITFDMGGTSTDVALCEGEPQWGTEHSIAGLPLRLPALDLHTVGAGGGSIAWLDAGGALRVGPQSAGADPGPACYGRQRGAPQATVTDAHVVLGHLPEGLLLAGSQPLDHQAAYAAIAGLAQAAQLTPVQLAEGILRVAETTMARAIQRISLERGHDPRDYALLPFGGAGGLHAARLAEQLGLDRVLVPVMPGLLSAYGMLCSAPLYAYSQGVMLQLAPDAAHGLHLHPAVTAALDKLRRSAEAARLAEGLAEADWVLKPSVDLRYAGQAYEINVPLTGTDALARFTARHAELYGYTAPEKPVEVVTVRLLAGGRGQDMPLPQLAPRPAGSALADAAAQLTLQTSAGPCAALHYERDALYAGDILAGPAVITERSATTLIPAGWQAAVMACGLLQLQRDAQGRAGDE